MKNKIIKTLCLSIMLISVTNATAEGNGWNGDTTASDAVGASSTEKVPTNKNNTTATTQTGNKYQVQIGTNKTGLATGKDGKAELPKNTVFSGLGLQGGADNAIAQIDTKMDKNKDIREVVLDWVRWLIPLISIIAVIAIIWAGILYITAFGEDGNKEKAKNIIIYVVIGLLLVIASYSIVYAIITAFF